MSVVAIIQARMGSTRLPGKVMLPLGGIPAVQLLVKRLFRCRQLDRIVVAVSDASLDDAFACSLREAGIAVYRGSERDVLARYYAAATAYKADVIVRLTGDCPLMDPEVVDLVVEQYRQHRPDYAYVSNLNPPTYPDGLDVEVFSYEALSSAVEQAEWASEREHVTPYIRQHPETFPALNIRGPVDYSYYRWTLDEERDYAFLQALVRLAEAEGLQAEEVRFPELLDILARHPQLTACNEGIARNEGAAKSLQSDVFMERGRTARLEEEAG